MHACLETSWLLVQLALVLVIPQSDKHFIFGYGAKRRSTFHSGLQQTSRFAPFERCTSAVMDNRLNERNHDGWCHHHVLSLFCLKVPYVHCKYFLIDRSRIALKCSRKLHDPRSSVSSLKYSSNTWTERGTRVNMVGLKIQAKHWMRYETKSTPRCRTSTSSGLENSSKYQHCQGRKPQPGLPNICKVYLVTLNYIHEDSWQRPLSIEVRMIRRDDQLIPRPSPPGWICRSSQRPICCLRLSWKKHCLPAFNHGRKQAVDLCWGGIIVSNWLLSLKGAQQAPSGEESHVVEHKQLYRSQRFPCIYFGMIRETHFDRDIQQTHTA